MKIAHVAPYGPNKSGLYEAVRDMIKADVMSGHEVYFVDKGFTRKTGQEYAPKDSIDDRGGFKIILTDHSILNDVDIIIDHAGIPSEWLTNKNIPIICITHGRPHASFNMEYFKKQKTYTCEADIAKNEQVKKIVYFWPEFKPYWDVIYPEDKTCIFEYPTIDQYRFCPEGKKHIIDDKHKGEFNILICDSWREDIDMFEIVNGIILAAKTIKNFKVHFYGMQTPIRPCWDLLIKEMYKLNCLGELCARMSNMEKVYRSMDAVLTPHRIITRVIGEALLTNIPVIASESCKVAQFTCDPHDAYSVANAIKEFVNSNQETNKLNVLEQSKHLYLENYSKEMNKIYNEILNKKKEIISFDNLSVIIPFTSKTEERKKIFEWVYERTKQILPGAEIIVTSDERNNTQYFNKSMAINDGVKKATRDYICILDSDVFIDQKAFKKAYQLIKNYSLIIMHSTIKYLSKETSEFLISSNKNINYIEFESKNINIVSEYHNGVGTIILFEYKKFKEMFGFDERFVGWGYEDTIFYEAYNTLYNSSLHMNNYIYHIHHSHSNNDNGLNYKAENYFNNEYQNILKNNPVGHNKKIYEEYLPYKNNKNLMFNYIKNNSKSIFKEDSQNKRRAITCYIENKEYLINEFYGMYSSIKYINAEDTDIVVFGPKDVLSKIPNDCIKIECNPICDQQPWSNPKLPFPYDFINSIYFLTISEANILLNYDYVLKTDVDVFITPEWNNFFSENYSIGKGAYVNDQLTYDKIRNVAKELNLNIKPDYNLGATHYGKPQDIINVMKLTYDVSKYWIESVFINDCGKWPSLWYGVTSMYAGEIAVNHLINNINKIPQKIDYNSNREEILNGQIHIHCYHTNEDFSKFKFRKGEYDNVDISKLDLNIIKDYCLYHILNGQKIKREN